VATDSEILAQVKNAFGRCKRPVHFTNWTHCSECEEHDSVLRSRSVETLRLQDIGNPGWDPLCFISAEGFKYYFPAVARITLDGSEADWFGNQLLFHLTYQGSDNRHLVACDQIQRQSVLALLTHLQNTRAKLISEYLKTDDWNAAIGLWRS
jgi:hypothetical protein